MADGAMRRFAGGVGYLGAGLRLWATSPRVMFLGAVPALVVAAAYLTGIVILIANLGAVASWITPFATSWEEPFRSATRIAAAVALLVAMAYAAVLTFTAVTLMVGDPFYERVWRAVEERSGGVPAVQERGLLRSLARGAANGIRLFVTAAFAGVALFFCGFIPVLGQSVVPAIGIVVTGWLLAVELSGFAFDARGMTLRERRRMLRTNRAGALGFGIATALMFLIPFLAVAVMPAAVAGGTLLARDVIAGSQVQAGTTAPAPGTPR